MNQQIQANQMQQGPRNWIYHRSCPCVYTTCQASEDYNFVISKVRNAYPQMYFEPQGCCYFYCMRCLAPQLCGWGCGNCYPMGEKMLQLHRLVAQMYNLPLDYDLCCSCITSEWELIRLRLELSARAPPQQQMNNNNNLGPQNPYQQQQFQQQPQPYNQPQQYNLNQPYNQPQQYNLNQPYNQPAQQNYNQNPYQQNQHLEGEGEGDAPPPYEENSSAPNAPPVYPSKQGYM